MNKILLALLVACFPTAFAIASGTVDGVYGRNHNNCKSPQTACKTIGHAISLASSGDSVRVAAAALHRESHYQHQLEGDRFRCQHDDHRWRRR